MTANQSQWAAGAVFTAMVLCCFALMLPLKDSAGPTRSQRIEALEAKVAALESTVKVLENAVRCPAPGWGAPLQPGNPFQDWGTTDLLYRVEAGLTNMNLTGAGQP